MVAETAFFTIQPAGFLNTLPHHKFRMPDAGSFDGIIHGLHFCFIGLLGMKAGTRREAEKEDSKQ